MAAFNLMESSQRALHIATLVLNNGTACNVEELQQQCCLFPVCAREIQDLCALKCSPLQVLEDNRIGLTADFLIGLRSRLETYGGVCTGTLRSNRATFLVPAVPSVSLVSPPAKGGVAQDLDIKEVHFSACIIIF